MDVAQVNVDLKMMDVAQVNVDLKMMDESPLTAVLQQNLHVGIMEVEVKQLLFHGVPQPQLDEVHQLKLVNLLVNRSQQDILQLFKEQPRQRCCNVEI
jgi:hypothetical protein